jgi:hypothetical protein
MRLRISRTRSVYLHIGMERVIRRGHSSSPTATKANVELGVREAFDSLNARVEMDGGVVEYVMMTGVVEVNDETPHAFAMAEGFTNPEEVFRFALLNATAMGDAIGVPVHVGVTERPGQG